MVYKNSLFILSDVLIGLMLFSQSCFHETVIKIETDFTVFVPDDDYSVPVEISVTNHTKGADGCQWTFEGGEPASSKKYTPDNITYSRAGVYKITLEAWNSSEREKKEFTLKLDSVLTVDFELLQTGNSFSPVTITPVNRCVGASGFRWTFEGGEPAASEQACPPAVVFREAGIHKVGLEATNGRERYTASAEIRVLPALEVGFELIPFLNDEDYEVPFRARLVNKTVSGLTYQWQAAPGVVSNDTAYDTDVLFATPGTYQITLRADNEKEVKSSSRTVTVKKNSNLYIMRDVRFGITTAQDTIGCFYSCSQRQLLKRKEITEKTGPFVEIVFWGLGETFRHCRFISPDQTGEYAFDDIPGAQHTAFINLPSSVTGHGMSIDEFNCMADDSVLHLLPFDNSSGSDGYFDGTMAPHLILFRTSDGKKGALKIIAFIRDGNQSYLSTDIKMQKERR